MQSKFFEVDLSTGIKLERELDEQFKGIGELVIRNEEYTHIYLGYFENQQIVSGQYCRSNSGPFIQYEKDIKLFNETLKRYNGEIYIINNFGEDFRLYVSEIPKFDIVFATASHVYGLYEKRKLFENFIPIDQKGLLTLCKPGCHSPGRLRIKEVGKKPKDLEGVMVPCLYWIDFIGDFKNWDRLNTLSGQMRIYTSPRNCQEFFPISLDGSRYSSEYHDIFTNLADEIWTKMENRSLYISSKEICLPI